MRSIASWLGAVMTLLAASAPAAAQANYPGGTVNIVLPLAAGTGMDTLVRTYADKLQTSLGAPVVVRNEPGASFMIAPTNVSKAAPDGRTLLATVSSTLVVNQTLFKQIQYDPAKDFIPISYYVKSPFVLVTGADSPIKSAADFIKMAKTRAHPFTYASLGPGTSQNLAMQLLRLRFGIELTEVPYRATPQQITDIATGNVDIGFVEAGASQALIQDGKLRALAVSSGQRFKLYPDVPTVAEALNAPDYEAISWHMLLAPAGTPKPVIDRLHSEMNRITASPEFLMRANALGLIPIESPSPGDIQKFLAAESKKWGDLLTKIGLAGTQ